MRNLDSILKQQRALALFMLAACVMLMAGLSACQPVAGLIAGEQDIPPLVGQVTFPAYRVQATIGEVASASTVTLIDATTNVSVSNTLTDASGSFSLTFTQNTYKPVSNRTYYLEASKGLDNNLAGRDSARVRTMVNYNVGWRSITGAVANSKIYLNEGTTAVSVIASHKGPAAVSPDSLIGVLTVGPEVFTPVVNVSDAEFSDVRAMVVSLLIANGDPVALIGYEPGPPERFVPKVSGSTLTATPAALSVAETVTLQGLTFDPTLVNNVVTFNGGVPGTVTGISSDRRSLYVQVPPGATTGLVTILLNGQIYGVPSLTILGTLNAGLY